MAMVMSLVLSKIISRKKEPMAPFIVELLRIAFRNCVRCCVVRVTAQRFYPQRGPSSLLRQWSCGFWYFPNGSGELESSWLAHLGRWMEPCSPLARIGNSASLFSRLPLAREVFVSTQDSSWNRVRRR